MDCEIMRPSYYRWSGTETWDFIEENGLDFLLGNVVKYVVRAGKKRPEKEIEDLEKGLTYLSKAIQVKRKRLEFGNGIVDKSGLEKIEAGRNEQVADKEKPSSIGLDAKVAKFMEKFATSLSLLFSKDESITVEIGHDEVNVRVDDFKKWSALVATLPEELEMGSRKLSINVICSDSRMYEKALMALFKDNQVLEEVVPGKGPDANTYFRLALTPREEKGFADAISYVDAANAVFGKVGSVVFCKGDC